MSTEYPTKAIALMTGMIYAGRKDLTNGKSFEEIMRNPEITEVDKKILQFSYVHEDCTTLEFKNSNGEIVQIASTKFRNGYDLWLIDSKSGYSIRT